jgi:hypothetical protein
MSHCVHQCRKWRAEAWQGRLWRRPRCSSFFHAPPNSTQGPICPTKHRRFAENYRGWVE